MNRRLEAVGLVLLLVAGVLFPLAAWTISDGAALATAGAVALAYGLVLVVVANRRELRQ